jgi:arabinose-5-phosphate isomerase
MPEVIDEIERKTLGLRCVVDARGGLLGVITFGVLGRYMRRSPGLLERTAAEVMTPEPVTLGREALAAEALRLLEERKITSLVVVEPDGGVAGVVHLHDLWRTGMV